MVAIRDSATITTLDDARLALRDTSISTRAFYVWRSARTEASFNEKTCMFDGSLRRIVLGLWPEMSPSSMTSSRDQLIKEIYEYLRHTGNAVCISRQNPTRWRLSERWNDIAPSVPMTNHHVRPEVTVTPLGLNKRERARELTQAQVDARALKLRLEAEAAAKRVDTSGEVPPPDPAGDAATPNTATVEGFDFDVLAFVTDATNGQPITVPEVATALHAQRTKTRSALNSLVANGHLFARHETTEEKKLRLDGMSVVGGFGSRMSILYSAVDPIPARTVSVLVPGVTVNEVSDVASLKKIRQALNLLETLTLDEWTPASAACRALEIPGGSVASLVAWMESENYVESTNLPMQTHYMRKVQHVRATKIGAEWLRAQRPNSGLRGATVTDITTAPSAVPVITEPEPVETSEQASDIATAIEQFVLRSTTEITAERDAALAENERLRAEFTAIQSQLDAANAQLDRVRSVLTTLGIPTS